MLTLTIISQQIKRKTIKEKRSNIGPIGYLFATMIVGYICLSSLSLMPFPFPIKPTIVHIPVIIAASSTGHALELHF